MIELIGKLSTAKFADVNLNATGKTAPNVSSSPRVSSHKNFSFQSTLETIMMCALTLEQTTTPVTAPERHGLR